MEIKRGNTVVCDVYLKDNSYTVEEIMGEDTLILNFLSRNVVELQINDYIDFEGTKYKVRHNEKVTKRETSLGWEYTVQFYSSRYDLLDSECFLQGTPERKKNFDYYTGTALDWLTLFVKNMNRTGSGWVAGSCIESRMITRWAPPEDNNHTMCIRDSGRTLYQRSRCSGVRLQRCLRLLARVDLRFRNLP